MVCSPSRSSLSDSFSKLAEASFRLPLAAEPMTGLGQFINTYTLTQHSYPSTVIVILNKKMDRYIYLYLYVGDMFRFSTPIVCLYRCVFLFCLECYVLSLSLSHVFLLFDMSIDRKPYVSDSLI